MTSLAERQDAFGRALLDAGRPLPTGLSAPAAAALDDRFAVYRANVTISLIEGLRDAFPVVDRLVGDAFFTAMAATHALQRPPVSPVMLAYGEEFPAFIAQFPPAAGLPYLADVARLEWAWLSAYHAAEASPLSIDDLRAIVPERLPLIGLTLHPSARLLGFDHPAVTIWQAHQSPDEPDAIDADAGAEAALIVRPHAIVAVVPLSAGAFAFMRAIAAGQRIAEATTEALAVEPEIDLSALFHALFEAGAFCAFSDRAENDAAIEGENG